MGSNVFILVSIVDKRLFTGVDSSLGVSVDSPIGRMEGPIPVIVKLPFLMSKVPEIVTLPEMFTFPLKLFNVIGPPGTDDTVELFVFDGRLNQEDLGGSFTSGSSSSNESTFMHLSFGASRVFPSLSFPTKAGGSILVSIVST